MIGQVTYILHTSDHIARTWQDAPGVPSITNGRIRCTDDSTWERLVATIQHRGYRIDPIGSEGNTRHFTVTPVHETTSHQATDTHTCTPWAIAQRLDRISDTVQSLFDSAPGTTDQWTCVHHLKNTVDDLWKYMTTLNPQQQYQQKTTKPGVSGRTGIGRHRIRILTTTHSLRQAIQYHYTPPNTPQSTPPAWEWTEHNNGDLVTADDITWNTITTIASRMGIPIGRSPIHTDNTTRIPHPDAPGPDGFYRYTADPPHPL